MLAHVKQEWREFKRGRPGQRFQDRYERKRSQRSERSPVVRFLIPFAAVVMFVAGIALCILPGPGLPLLLLGGALLADISRRVAVAMDWLEVRVRAAIKKVRQWMRDRRVRSE